MGKNNRQRRAAKQRARHRRTSRSGTTGGRPHQSAADGTFARGESNQNDNPFSRAEASPNFEQPYRQQAERSLERLLRFRAGAPLVKHVVEQELVSLQLASLHAMDELITRQLLMVVAALWEHGWQPLDLVHVVRKAIPRSAQLIAAVITEQARAVGDEGRAPWEWLDQLRAVAEEAGDFAPPRTGQHRWLLIETMIQLSHGLVDAWADVVVLAGLVSDLPMLEQIASPPSSWGTRAAPSSSSEPDSDRHKLLNRIRALLAKAEATSYAAEAETFTAKAQDLMTRHAIDEALLAGTDEQVAVLAKRVHLDSPYASTKASLLNVVGKANRCKVIYSDRLAIATVVGVPVDVDQVEMLFTSLLIQATRAMAEAGAARPGSFDRSATFRRSFLTAYAVRIGERLTEANTAATESYGKELVPLLTRQQDAVQEEFDRLFPNTRALSGGYLDRRGWEAGRRAADRAYFTAGRIPA